MRGRSTGEVESGGKRSEQFPLHRNAAVFFFLKKTLTEQDRNRWQRHAGGRAALGLAFQSPLRRR